MLFSKTTSLKLRRNNKEIIKHYIIFDLDKLA